jgi:hypothetical protein
LTVFPAAGRQVSGGRRMYLSLTISHA